MIRLRTLKEEGIVNRKSKGQENNRVSKAAQELRSMGLRATPQRLAIIAYLEGNTSHPCAEQIYDAVKPGMPSLSLGTVYNTLDELARKGAIQELVIDPKKKHVDPNPLPHNHFLCEKCGKVYDYPDPVKLLNLPGENKGFVVQSYALNLYGICPTCRKARPRTDN